MTCVPGRAVRARGRDRPPRASQQTPAISRRSPTGRLACAAAGMLLLAACGDNAPDAAPSREFCATFVVVDAEIQRQVVELLDALDATQTSALADLERLARGSVAESPMSDLVETYSTGGAGA